MKGDKKMYFEKYEILDVEDVDNEKRITIKVKDDETIKFNVPEWELAAVMTEEPSDASEARNIKAIVVVDKIYDLFNCCYRLKNKKTKVGKINKYQIYLYGKCKKCCR